MAAEAEVVRDLTQAVERARATLAIGTQTVKDADGRSAEVLVKGPGVTVDSIKPYLDVYLKRPERKRGVLGCTELRSFIEAVNLHKRPTSVVFADVDAKCMTAVFDYHEPGAGAADWLGHRAKYPFPMTEEWEAWEGIHGDWIGQAALAEFLEEHAPDVVEPARAMDLARQWAEQLGIQFAAPARMMQLSRGLAVTVDRRIEEARNLGTGDATLRFEESHQGADGKPLSIPGALLIEIPIFKGGAAYQLPARLRYRVGQNRAEVLWQVSLWRADRALDDAVKEACETVRTETALPLIYGTPES